MGDWVTVTWWGIGSTRPVLPDRLAEDNNWGGRCGWAAPGLWQLDTVTKYGWAQPDFGRPDQWIFVAPGYGNVSSFGNGPLQVGFNYVMPQPSHRRRCPRQPTPTPEVLRDAAALLDGTLVAESTDQAMLCLSEVVPLDRAHYTWPSTTTPARPVALAQLVEALTLVTPDREVHHFLIGLWTPQFGYLHLGRLSIDLQQPDLPAQRALCLSGAYHPVVDEQRAGSRIGYLDIEPAALPTSRWPIG